MKSNPTDEQRKILENAKKKLIVSASAGSGKTFVVVEYLINLICDKKIPVNRLLVLTFTKAAANEMKTRLFKAILQQKMTPYLLEQLDEISISDISTIDSFCEKIIKRNINLLDIDENFRILDEKESKNLKLLAFNKIYEQLANINESGFDEIYFAFKRNKEQIFQCMLDLQSFFDSQDKGEELIDEFLRDSETLVKKALNYLNDKLKNILHEARWCLQCVFTEELPKGYQTFAENLNELASVNLSDNFFENCEKITKFNFVRTPSSKIEDLSAKENLVKAKNLLKDMVDLAGDFVTEEDLQEFYNTSLSSNLLKMNKLFIEQYKSLKQDKSCMDFADLEKQVKVLFKNEEIIKSLQNDYDYIFIDEYQDTNTLQESIIKPISEKGCFVAVGDPKQGIYGFRNASNEIMQKDIDDFAAGQDSQALFLTGNFRSDDRVLSFVNQVFDKLMTKDSVGIDYQKTSRLKGMFGFEKTNLPSVGVDFVIEQKEEEQTPPTIYSIKEDVINNSQKDLNEIRTIASRIDEILQGQIYDAKQKTMRKPTQGDIAILFRSRSQLMQDCVRYLQEKGFDVIADIKQTLIEDGQILVIASLLNLILNEKDDISLTAFLNSWFGGYSLDELAKLRENGRDKENFYEIFYQLNDEKSTKTRKLIEDFKFDVQVLGLTKALQQLFAKTNYYFYLNTLVDKNLKNFHLQELFKLIKTGNYDYNVCGLIEYLENIKTESSVPQQGANAITITTIHATKGLEYPIVILAGGGEKLGKIYNNSYIISSQFGLGTYLYDYEKNIKSTSPVFLATKLYKKRREFIDEIMIFYVAMTRAQNNLYITGTINEKKLSQKKSLFECDNYLELILYALGDNFKQQLLSQEEVVTENQQYRVVSEIKESNKQVHKEISDMNFILQANKKIVEEYINFQYPEKEYCKISYKNSVTGILKLNEEEQLETNYNQPFSQTSILREEAINRGNAYHEALKLIDFDKVSDLQSLSQQLDTIKDWLKEGYYQLIDKEILYKNILKLKGEIGQSKVFKEWQFIMQSSLKEIGEFESDKKVIVQGIVDLFALGEENILIDYKFTSTKNDSEIIERYAKQLELYRQALEKGFDVKIDKIYLLSLKNANLIRVL